MQIPPHVAEGIPQAQPIVGAEGWKRRLHGTRDETTKGGTTRTADRGGGAIAPAQPEGRQRALRAARRRATASS